MVIVFVLVYVFFTNQPAAQPQIMASLQETTPTQEYPTATLFPDAPPFPDAPTGPAELLPTPDFSRFPPAPAYDSTDEPEEEEPAGSEPTAYPPPVPLEFLEPSTTLTAYKDPSTGFSLEYPENWFFTVSSPESIYLSMSLRNSSPNSEESREGQLASPDAFAMDIDVLSGILTDFASLDSYVDTIFSEGFLTSRKHLEPIQGNEVIQVVYPSLNYKQDYEEIYIAKGDTVYHIGVPTPHTRYRDLLFQILNSFVYP